MKDMKWISVKERLPPEISGEYIIYDEDVNLIGVAYYEHTGWEYRFHREDYDDFTHEDVTHWMPLPEPPKTIKR